MASDSRAGAINLRRTTGPRPTCLKPPPFRLYAAVVRAVRHHNLGHDANGRMGGVARDQAIRDLNPGPKGHWPFAESAERRSLSALQRAACH